jgi:hypothetical protein
MADDVQMACARLSLEDATDAATSSTARDDGGSLVPGPSLLLRLPHSVLHRIAARLASSGPHSAGLEGLGSSCSGLRAAALAVVPGLRLGPQQLCSLATCRHVLHGAAELQLDLTRGAATAASGPPPPGQQPLLTRLTLEPALAAALARLPNLRGVSLRSVAAGQEVQLLRPLLQRPQRLKQLAVVGRGGPLRLWLVFEDPAVEASSSAGRQQQQCHTQAMHVCVQPAASGLSGITQLTLQRLNLSSSNSNGLDVCPLGLIAVHMPALRTLVLDRVALGPHSLASLSAGPTAARAATSAREASADSMISPPAAASSSSSTTGLVRSLQSLALVSIRQGKQLRLQHVSRLTALTALHLANLDLGPLDSDEDEDDAGDTGAQGSGDEAGSDEMMADDDDDDDGDAGSDGGGSSEDADGAWQPLRDAGLADRELDLAAVLSLPRLAALTVHRVPALASSGGSWEGAPGGGNVLTGSLASLSALQRLAAPLCLRDRQLCGAWAAWSHTLVELQVWCVCVCGGGFL